MSQKAKNRKTADQKSSETNSHETESNGLKGKAAINIEPKSNGSSRRAKPLMILGTMSNAGKSLIAAGLCRVFAEEGYRVAPFKAQNMALNSFITDQGEEMGRSQVIQAQACFRKPEARMNPILLKPSTDHGSQIILMGHPVADMEAREYYQHKDEYIPYVQKAYESLAAENDIIILEGAGSPAEINLKDKDLVNMAMASMADAPALLVGNIDPGGVFAQLYGTLCLLESEEQNRIRGLIINKFRGDCSILEPGIEMLEEKTGKPVLGVLPYLDVRLEPEDSLALEDWVDNGVEENALDIAVIRLPRISNTTDFVPLSLEPDVGLRYVSDHRELGTPDVIILPGTKSTIQDLLWLRKNGFETAIRRAYDHGAFLLGICGGYQMLGVRIRDPEGAECQGDVRGMGYLNMETVFSKEKIMRQTKEISHFGIPALDGRILTGYEIHMGRAAVDLESNHSAGNRDRRMSDSLADSSYRPENGAAPTTVLHAQGDTHDQNDVHVTGTYMHGLFDEDEFRQAFIGFLRDRREDFCKGFAEGRQGESRLSYDVGRRQGESRLSYGEFREKQLEELAKQLRRHLDIPAICRIMGL